ncbi:MAG TPA: DUF6599 family protein [Planctomycetota bacterium]|nr:DUF6599 family protein [Planctomycetota bacterium]
MRATPSLLFRCWLVVLLWLLAGGCTITSEGVQNFEVPIEDLLPPSRVVASYRQLNKPLRLKDSELEEQFGGKERIDIIEKWSRVTTVYSDYGIPERPPKARVSVTEMSTKLNAYGAYSNLRPPDLSEKSYVKIGVHGTVIDERLFFVQDKFLIVVRDLSGSQDPERRAMLINFGHALSSRVPRDITDISMVGYLPYEHRVPASERIEKDDPFGLNVFKQGCCVAKFRIEKREITVFVAEFKDKGGAHGAFKAVRSQLEKQGKLDELGFAEEGFIGTMDSQPAMIAKREAVVFGCFGSFDDKEMKSLMSNIDRRVKPYVPPKIKEPEKNPADEEEKKNKQGK